MHHLNGLIRESVLQFLDRDMSDMGNILIYGKDRKLRDAYLKVWLEQFWKQNGHTIDLDHIRPNQITFEESKNSKKPMYQACHYYTRVNMDICNIGDRNTGMALLNSLTTSSTIDRTKLMVILDNVDSMPSGTEYGLRKVLELYHVQFILIARNISLMEPTVVSRVLMLNVNPLQLNLETPALIKHVVAQILSSKASLVRSPEKIRSTANRLHSSCIPFALFARELISQVKEPHKIVAKAAEYDFYFCTGNKKLLVYEAFLAELLMIMTN